MSSNKCVIVLAPNGRRQTVKVTPNTTILQVLEEVCAKQGFQPEEYDIKHHNHILDTTSIMRFSGLPNNAQLEMTKIRKIREESNVVLGLQLESGDRVTGSFSPAESLWEVIKKLCPDEADPDSNPVIIYMRREISGVNNLVNTTLRSLGLTGGRAMLRFVHRTPEELHHQANVSGLLPQRSVICEEKPKHRVTSKSDSPPEHPVEKPTVLPQGPSSSLNYKSPMLNEEHTESTFTSEQPSKTMQMSHMDTDRDVVKDSSVSMEVDNHEVSCESAPVTETSEEDSEEPIIFLGERGAIVFSLAMAQAVQYKDLPDDFFDLTVDDVRSLFRDLKRRSAQLEENQLETRAIRELEASKRVLNQLNQYRRVVLRIQFPDRTVLQGTFTPVETMSTVMEFVKGYLEEPSRPFHLYTTPPKTILPPEARLVDAGCVPCAVVHFGAEETGSNEVTYLRKEVLSQFTSPTAAAVAACKTRGIVPAHRSCSAPSSGFNQANPKAGHSSQIENRSSGASTSRTSTRHDKSEGGPSNKVPKWFKPSK